MALPRSTDDDREALLLKGVLDLCVLSLLVDQPRHAYGLVEALRERGFDQTGHGTIYPLVTRLRRLDLVTQRAEHSPHGPARHVLSVTPLGRAALAQWLPTWREVSVRVARVLDPTATSEETLHA